MLLLAIKKNFLSVLYCFDLLKNVLMQNANFNYIMLTLLELWRHLYMYVYYHMYRWTKLGIRPSVLHCVSYAVQI